MSQSSSAALFINGIFESVLEEILAAQSQFDGLTCFLQPHSSRRIVMLRDRPPSPERPVILYASTSSDLDRVHYRARIVGWFDKEELEPSRRSEFDALIRLHQPREGGLYERGNSGAVCANLLLIESLERLDHPVTTSALVRCSDKKPLSSRTQAGGWSPVEPTGELTNKRNAALPTVPWNLHAYASAINELASEYEIGTLQALRAELKGHSRRASSSLFELRYVTDEYGLHYGGRKELQFNIGVETDRGQVEVRHGVAFSLEPSRSLPRIEPLVPKVARFNDYIRSKPESFPGFEMWHYQGGKRSQNRPVSAVTDDLVQEGTFIMLGRSVPLGRQDARAALRDFDRLLPLYRFVESSPEAAQNRDSPTTAGPLEFTPGCPEFARTTTLSMPARTLDISLTHKMLQTLLYAILCREEGPDNVAVEQPLSGGQQVDLAVKRGQEYLFYELKTAQTARQCIREALGQLLEYAHWPNEAHATQLFVVGEAELGTEGEAYLSLLRERFFLPVHYRRLDRAAHTLGHPQ